MLNIYLCRHGQDQDNINGILNGHRDTPLTETGISQAENTAQELFNRNIIFDFIYSSPLKRALQTANIISSKLNNPKPEIHQRLIERNFGIMTGKRITDIEALCSPNIIKTERIIYFLEAKNSESFPNLTRRAQKVIKFVKSKHQSGNILLVTHGDIGKMLYCAYHNLDWKEVLKTFHFGNSEILLLSDSIIQKQEKLISTKQYNL